MDTGCNDSESGEVSCPEDYQKVRLRVMIAGLDAGSLRSQGAKFFSESSELIRQALIFALDFVSADELVRWEQMLERSDKTSDIGGQIKSCTIEATFAACEEPEQVAVPVRVVRPLAVKAVDAVEAAPVIVESEVRGREVIDSNDANLLDLWIQEDTFDPPDWSLEHLSAEDIYDVYEWPAGQVSRGTWLAAQQELRLKDFAMQQLERQLGFERGCYQWLESTLRTRECREEQVGYLAHDVMEDAEALHVAGIAVQKFRGEDRWTEDVLLSQNSVWWRTEAKTVETLQEGMQSQLFDDHAGLTTQDRQMYDAHVAPQIDRIVRDFECRRGKAEQWSQERVHDLHDHHSLVLQRHLSTLLEGALTQGEGDDDDPECEPLGAPSPDASATGEPLGGANLDASSRDDHSYSRGETMDEDLYEAAGEDDADNADDFGQSSEATTWLPDSDSLESLSSFRS